MMNFQWMKFSALLSLALASSVCAAKPFVNEYIGFNLPDDWNCQPSPPSWICDPSKPTEKKFALITLTAKEASAIDQIQNFKAELSKPRSHSMGSDTPILSKVLKNEVIPLNGHQWVQSLHQNGEVNQFKTIYLATVNRPIAIMITLSAEDKHWDKFAPMFAQMISSIRLRGVPTGRTKSVDQTEGFTPFGGAPAAPGALADFSEPVPAEGKGSFPMVYIVGLVLAALALGAAFLLFVKK
ncbi:MAG TPA: hypothetical protein DCL41_04980 [Bdellovibrionales bacterium]|nr:hypothetical protein [Pseudobdellovibrionaceae bacterium]HAG91200.1 hypothetical protein [Bdellovibrionales bacterium]|tara:strand:- start:1125 stop:1844 length:720 start_codon:yes stop_codon:yes gene_type:complete